MNCSQCKKNLSAYSDGELSKAQQDAVARHLRDCPDCRAALDRTRRAVEALSGLPEEAPPPDFIARLNERLDAEDLKHSRRRWFFLIRPYLLPWAATVAMACLAIVLVSRLAEHAPPGTAPQLALPGIVRQQSAPPVAGSVKAEAGPARGLSAKMPAEPETRLHLSNRTARPRAAKSAEKTAPVEAFEAEEKELQDAAAPAPPEEEPAARALKRKAGAAFPAALQWQGSTSAVTEAATVAVYSEEDWEKLWQRHAPETQPPKIDFSRYMALAVFQGSQDQSRCCIRITGIIQTPDKIRVFYGMDKPASEQGSGPFSSFHIKLIKKSALPVMFTQSGN